MLRITEVWRERYPNAAVGLLAMGDVANPESHEGLAQRKRELEEHLRARFQDQDRSALKASPVFQAYNAYYKRFKKSYHVLLQLESVALKGRSIPRVAALVEAMFMAELKNMLLTAGHDLDSIQQPLTLDVAAGDEQYIGIGGREQNLKRGDMMIADAEGIISSIIYGPDRRTRIRPDTDKVMFTVYGPQGITEEAILQHLGDIEENISLVSPGSMVLVKRVYGVG